MASAPAATPAAIAGPHQPLLQTPPRQKPGCQTPPPCQPPPQPPPCQPPPLPPCHPPPCQLPSRPSRRRRGRRENDGRPHRQRRQARRPSSWKSSCACCISDDRPSPSFAPDDNWPAHRRGPLTINLYCHSRILRGNACFSQKVDYAEKSPSPGDRPRRRRSNVARPIGRRSPSAGRDNGPSG